MPPKIENVAGISLTPDTIQVLKRIFTRYKRVVIIKEFTAGLSGSRVLEVRPIKIDGTPELPTVVKLATVSMIEQEWRAYRQHIQNRLPRVAGVSTRPTLLAAGWGGLRYPAMGSGSPDILSLRDFACQADVSPADLVPVLERLFRIMDNVWGYYAALTSFTMQASYARVLPPQLTIQIRSDIATTPIPINPQSLPEHSLHSGQEIALSGFVIRKIDPTHHTITLSAPHQQGAMVRLQLSSAEPMPTYRLEQELEISHALVVETCIERICREVSILLPQSNPLAEQLLLAPQIWLTNPIPLLNQLLKRQRQVHSATIHGDFNLQNILIEPQLGDISLIDFAEARQDHVLHDLLHLEVEVLTHILPEMITQYQLDPLLTLAVLSQHAHRVLSISTGDSSSPLHPALGKVWVMLAAIRRRARSYLFDLHDPTEYYQGLTLYLLGALRYKNLQALDDTLLPKRIALWAALLAYQWYLYGEATPPALAMLFQQAQILWQAEPPRASAEPPPEPASSSVENPQYIDRITLLPVQHIPPSQPLAQWKTHSI